MIRFGYLALCVCIWSPSNFASGCCFFHWAGRLRTVNRQQVQIVDLVSKSRTTMHQKPQATADVQLLGPCSGGANSSAQTLYLDRSIPHEVPSSFSAVVVPMLLTASPVPDSVPSVL